MKKLLLSLIFIVSFSSLTFAATFDVNNNGDTNDANTSDNLCLDASGNCTLRAAIQQASASAGDDTITFGFVVFPTTITLTLGELQINSNITITGTGARNLIISGNNTSRVFSISGFGVVVNLSGLTVADGYVGNFVSGGGIRTVNGATLNLIQVTVRNNFAGGFGGGIFHFLGRLNILNSTISNNTAREGGGINNNDGAANIANTTISDNTALYGGGIINFAQMTLNNVTISNNTATGRGGGLRDDVIADVRNTIIANNTAPSGSDVDGAFTSLGNNLIGNSTDSTGFTNGVNGDKVGTSTASIDPKLGALQNNGGQTDTRALLAGNPAIDSGNNCVVTATCPSDNPPFPLTTDQRGAGFSRQVDGNNDAEAVVDIGAFEAFVSTSVTVSGRVINANGRGIFRAVVRFTDTNGVLRFARTNPFGYYRFNDVIAGNTYVFDVRDKSYTFAPQVLSIVEDYSNLNFTASPISPPPGGIKLLNGYVHIPERGIDTWVGRIKKEGGLDIRYDIGRLAGEYVKQCLRDNTCVWYKEQQLKGGLVKIALKNNGTIFATFPRTTANFYAEVKSQEDIADFLIMILTYDETL